MDNSYHHLYYSAHADPAQELEKLNKSCLKLNSTTQNGSHAFSAESHIEDEDFKPNFPKTKSSLTINGHSESNSATRQLLPQNNNITTQTRDVVVKHPTAQGTSRCSCCCITSVLCCILLGFLGGVFIGLLAHRNGYGSHLDRVFQIKHGTVSIERSEDNENIENASENKYKCTVRLNQNQRSNLLENCDTCFKARLLNVSNAHYADCNGLYTLTNLSSVWDTKRTVFQRIFGGINPQDKRYIYWNSHFYGPNFYGWSIGDSRSLFESGPFHAQGREGVRDQPWLGSWNDNVTVTMVTCGDVERAKDASAFRFDKKKMEELLHKNLESGLLSDEEQFTEKRRKK